MFSSLSLGSLLYILDKTDGIKLKIGEVVSMSAPRANYQAPFSTVDIKVNVNGTVFEYNQIPSQNSIVTYNNGKITISETKQALLQETESLLQNNKQILNNIDTYSKNVDECEQILKELNPLFAKEKEMDTRITNVEDKLDEILKLLQK